MGVYDTDPPKSLFELEVHLRSLHPNKRGKDLIYFKTLKEKLQKRITLDSVIAINNKMRRRWFAGVLQYFIAHSEIMKATYYGRTADFARR